jgi:hypothetical protein
VNGSFEIPMVAPATEQSFRGIPGWDLAYGPEIEVQNNIASSRYTPGSFEADC